MISLLAVFESIHFVASSSDGQLHAVILLFNIKQISLSELNMHCR